MQQRQLHVSDLAQALLRELDRKRCVSGSGTDAIGNARDHEAQTVRDDGADSEAQAQGKLEVRCALASPKAGKAADHPVVLDVLVVQCQAGLRLCLCLPRILGRQRTSQLGSALPDETTRADDHPVIIRVLHLEGLPLVDIPDDVSTLALTPRPPADGQFPSPTIGQPHPGCQCILLNPALLAANSHQDKAIRHYSLRVLELPRRMFGRAESCLV
mmetsp:Transcript_28000/g.65364  ORF Transcript_28000/g.65364 Transcript_28000/m.65364 type:complete len:215 (+) Transcript_28000:342-986(+)